MSNPVLKDHLFIQSATKTQSMTLQGTVVKTFALLLLAATSASWVWYNILKYTNAKVMFTYLFLGLIGGIIIGFLTVLLRTWSALLAPLYALFEGAFLGSISFYFELRYPGIVLQALPLTFSLLFCMLFLYTIGLIKASRRLQTIIAISLGAFTMTVLIDWGLSMFSNFHLGILHGSTIWSIGFSLLLVIIGALSLVMDFHFIEKRVKEGSPRYMEWYSAFGLMVTLVWIYLRVLDLISKLQDRKRR
ncbi:MAG: Bax inhibitor-1/YccA family protein [Bacteroidota bacterium]